MLDRRGILKFLMAGAAGSLLTPLPWKLLDDSTVWTQNWPWLPSGAKGDVTYARTSSKLCPTAAGMRVQMVGGLPVRTLPDPAHPLSLGGLSPLAASEVQLLYSPARIRSPLLRDAGGSLRPVTYEQAKDVFFTRLRSIKNSGQADRLLCLCGDETGSISQVLSLLTNRLGSRHCYFMPSDLQPAATAARQAGMTGLPAYHLEQCDFLLCIGADMLDSWGTAMRSSALLAQRRPAGQSAALKLVFAGPARNNTALAADQWIPLRPGAEALFLLALCRIIAGESAPQVIIPYTVQEISALCGAPLPVLRQLAQSLSSARQPLVVTGAALGQGGNPGTDLLGYALNSLLPGRAMTCRAAAGPLLAGASSHLDMACQDFYRADKLAPDMLITYDANPAYALPVGFRKDMALERIPCKVAFASCLDETALGADLVFPLPFGLERLDDVLAPLGSGETVYSICPQIVRPPDGIQPVPEILFAALEDLGAVPQTLDGREVRNLETLLRAKAGQLGAVFRNLRRGEPHVAKNDRQPLPDFLAILAALPGITGLKPDLGALTATPLTRPALGTPNSGIPPYSPKLIPDTELSGQELFVRLNSKTVRNLNLTAGQQVNLSAQLNATERITLSARLAVSEEIMDNVLGLPLGYGHAGFTAFSCGKGVSGLDLYSLDHKQGQSGLVLRGLKVTGA